MRLFLTLAGMLALCRGFAAVPVYPLQSASQLQFQGTQQGEKFTGLISRFEARIAYDPANAVSSSFDVTMQLKSMDSRNAERDQAMQTADWFDVSHYPVATFRTVAFRTTPQGTVADADLTIKGRTKRIVFPFQWLKTATGATLDARVTVDRLDFGLGAGEWADDSLVGRKVDVIVHLVLLSPPLPGPAGASQVVQKPRK